MIEVTRKGNNRSAIVIVDVFRAFTTACYVLDQSPQSYCLTNRCKEITTLAQNSIDPILIGKPEIESNVKYSIPNSPTRSKELDLKGRTVLHRTAAGGTGVIKHTKAEHIFAATFPNADATCEVIEQMNPSRITLIPMGYEGNLPALEDTLCAQYIEGLLTGRKVTIADRIEELRKTSGLYFFGEDQEQYPQKDFDQCLELRRFNFAIQVEPQESFAILRASESLSSKEQINSVIR